MSSEAPIAIVGAGLAGLNCARELHAQGLPVRIYEKSDGVGGRVRTDVVDGYRLDRGFQVLLTAYPTASRVFDYSALELCRFDPGALVRVSDRFSHFADPWRRPGAALSTLLSPVGSLRDKLLVAKLRREVCRGASNPREGDQGTAKRLQDFGFSDRIMERFFRPFLGGVFLERDLDTPAHFFDFVFRMFSTGDAAVPRLGMGTLTEQIPSSLPDGTVQLETEVVEVSGDGVRLATGEKIEASATVIAVDTAHLSKLVPSHDPKPMHAVSCFYFAADASPCTDPILVLNGTGHGPINNLCVPSQVSSDYAPAGKSLVSVTTLGVPETSFKELEQAVIDQLEQWYGKVARTWESISSYEIPYALPPVPKAGEALPEGLPTGVFVAGDHLESPSIEGALISGQKAARAVLERLA